MRTRLCSFLSQSQGDAAKRLPLTRLSFLPCLKDRGFQKGTDMKRREPLYTGEPQILVGLTPTREVTTSEGLDARDVVTPLVGVRPTHLHSVQTM